MTYPEIIEKLKASMKINKFADEDYDDDDDLSTDVIRTGNDSFFVRGVGEYKRVASYGGTDKGTEWWVVNYFPDHDVYIKVNGYYTSYDGVEFSGGWRSCSEVIPQEKTIVVYQKV